jgi:hypothetical protein
MTRPQGEDRGRAWEFVRTFRLCYRYIHNYAATRHLYGRFDFLDPGCQQLDSYWRILENIRPTRAERSQLANPITVRTQIILLNDTLHAMYRGLPRGVDKIEIMLTAEGDPANQFKMDVGIHTHSDRYFPPRDQSPVPRCHLRRDPALPNERKGPPRRLDRQTRPPTPLQSRRRPAASTRLSAHLHTLTTLARGIGRRKSHSPRLPEPAKPGLLPARDARHRRGWRPRLGPRLPPGRHRRRVRGPGGPTSPGGPA